MRPGRLSRKVIVPLPDEGGRAQILAVHLRHTPMASMDAKRHACAMVAKLTSGMSGAELANVCNEAALLAGRRSAEARLHLPASHCSGLQHPQTPEPFHLHPA